MAVYDLHSHTVFSDGELIVSELARRASVAGLSGIGMTDHGDMANVDFIVPRVAAAAAQWNKLPGFRVVPGIELTHVPPPYMAELVRRARDLGAAIVVVHGETVVEPVAPGTNRAAILAGADILAHPGLLSEEDAVLARDRGVLLEITARKGHSLTNGHVAALAKKTGAGLVLNSDAHSPSDILTPEHAKTVALGAGLSLADYSVMQQNSLDLVNRALAGR
ncbi:MAG: histidinol phosphate phosphatase domain-containing protein [Thermodesulfobacteriota bacterium]